MNDLLVKFVNQFEWESEAQKESFLSLVQYARSRCTNPMQIPDHILACYLFQKEHESNQWWLEYIAGITRRLEDQISDLRQEIAGLRGRLE